MKQKLLLWSFAIVLILSGCKARRALEVSPLFPLSENALLSLVDQQGFDYSSLSSRLSISASTPGQSGSFKANLRMQKDSVIWMSITPALGIEAVRAIIRPDSLMYINKLKNQYFAGKYTEIDSLLQYSTKFDFLENILVGNAVEIEPDEKYVTYTDGLTYVLQTKVKHKIKKSVDINVKQTARDSSYGEVVKPRKFEKATEKFDDNDLIVKRYYIRASDFRISHVNIDDLLYGRSIRIKYSKFEEVDGQSFPMKVDIQVRTPHENTTLEIEHSRIKINEPQTYPFKIPVNYTSVR